MNDESRTDAEFVKKMIKKSSRELEEEQEPSNYYYYGKPAPKMPPFVKIRKTLASFKEIEEELGEPDGTSEYVRRRLERRVDCPLCAYYDSWNEFNLRDHIANHKEVKRYDRFWKKAKQEFDYLKERRELLHEQLDMLKRMGMGKEVKERKVESLEQQLRILESRIKRFQTSLDTHAITLRPDGISMVDLLY